VGLGLHSVTKSDRREQIELPDLAAHFGWRLLCRYNRLVYSIHSIRGYFQRYVLINSSNRRDLMRNPLIQIMDFRL
jgi:hypothetical protein